MLEIRLADICTDRALSKRDQLCADQGTTESITRKVNIKTVIDWSAPDDEPTKDNWFVINVDSREADLILRFRRAIEDYISPTNRILIDGSFR